MLDTEQANARIKQLEDQIDQMLRDHGLEMQRRDALSIEHIDQLVKDNEELREKLKNCEDKLSPPPAE